MYGALKPMGIKYSIIETLLLISPLSKFLAPRLCASNQLSELICATPFNSEFYILANLALKETMLPQPQTSLPCH